MMREDSIQTLITGRSGSGKTFFALRYIAKARRVVIFDTKLELSYKNDIPFNVIVVSSVAELKQALKDNWGRDFKICVKPPERRPLVVDIRQARVMLKKVISVLTQAQAPYKVGRDNRQLVLLIDECHIAFPPFKKDDWVTEFFSMHARYSGINTVNVSQRYAQVHMAIRAQRTVECIFALSEYADIKAVKDTIGGRRATPLMRQQREYQYIFRDKNGGISLRGGKI